MNKIELSTFQCNMCGGLGDTFLAMLLLIYRHLPFLNDELTIEGLESCLFQVDYLISNFD